MKKALLFVFLPFSFSWGSDFVTVINSAGNPIPIAGSFTASPSTATVPIGFISGTSTTTVSAGNPLPISGSFTANASTASVPTGFVSGTSTTTVTTSNPLPVQSTGTTAVNIVTGSIANTGFNVTGSTVGVLGIGGTYNTTSSTVGVIPANGFFNAIGSTVGVIGVGGGYNVTSSTVGVIPANGFFNVTGSTIGIVGNITSTSVNVTTGTFGTVLPGTATIVGFINDNGNTTASRVTNSSVTLIAIFASSNTVTPSNTQTTQLYTYQTNPTTTTVVSSTMGVIPANGFFNVLGSTVGIVTASPLAVISTGVPVLFLNNQNANAMGAVTNSNAQIVAVSPSSNTVSVQVSTVGVIPANGFFNTIGSTNGVTNPQTAPLFTYQTNPSTVTVQQSTMGVVAANGFFNITGSTAGIASTQANPVFHYQVNPSTVAVQQSTMAVIVPLGTPLPVGVSVASTSLSAGLTQGTTTPLYGTNVGQLLVTGVPYQVMATTFSLNVTAQAATDQVIISSPSAQSYNYVCGCAFNNSSATNAFVTLYQTTSAVNSGFDAMQIGVPANDVNAGVWPGCTNPFFRSKMGGQITLKASATATSTAMRCLYYVGP